MGKKLLFFILYFGVVPLVISFLALPLMGKFEMLMETLLSVLIAGGGLAGFFVSKKLLSSCQLKGYIALIPLPLTYTAVLWAVFMLINGGFYGADSWLFYCIFHIAYAPIYFVAMFGGEGRLFLWAPLAYELSFAIGVVIAAASRKVQFASVFNMRKQLLSILAVFLFAIGTGSAVHWYRSQTVLPSYGFKYAGGYSSTDLTPYDVTNPNNKLPKLNTKSTFIITNPMEMPVLDGAEAAFPVYSAFANATYENIHQLMGNGQEIVSFMNTIYAYERLLSGEVDIYFGAEPSKEQREMAKKAGKELVMTPIGKEAFVFFVNPKNEVDSLKVSEIKGIYSGEIKNWSKLGGDSEKIIAFQRPKNSGSQTLLEKIMGETKIMKPLKEDVPEGMGGIIEQVADYRNYQNAVGFSFRFFATGMKENPDIKLLAINGIEPSSENIASGKYPFTATLYAITLKDNPNPNIQPFLDWMQGPQGQDLVEKVGYIKLTQ
ncbi:PstS family phosphate ABC transporter substrate-binding protein [Neobacillus rhizophilus]|uniref:Substrate-binding domain-containing protein n=1 Tax=Neobacillus rhizophilus TaxID=2833579 RepID=A0A942YWM9_9BACI|nr:substrate-binding domain-containing protein [Neobacillus rhizophilus]MBS4216298.1 substrate-binding domain-containing protein [Neobacillus rhizophilus]